MKNIINTALFYQRVGIGKLHSHANDRATVSAIKSLVRMGYMEMYPETKQAKLIREFVKG